LIIPPVSRAPRQIRQPNRALPDTITAARPTIFKAAQAILSKLENTGEDGTADDKLATPYSFSILTDHLEPLWVR
jgi:hypothetical protein